MVAAIYLNQSISVSCSPCLKTQILFCREKYDDNSETHRYLELPDAFFLKAFESVWEGPRRLEVLFVLKRFVLEICWLHARGEKSQHKSLSAGKVVRLKSVIDRTRQMQELMQSSQFCKIVHKHHLSFMIRVPDEVVYEIHEWLSSQ